MAMEPSQLRCLKKVFCFPLMEKVGFQKVSERFLEGCFELRSWASNSNFVCDIFEDLSIQSNNLEFEKLLGYKYSTVNDTIQLTAYKKIDVSSGVTKRKILSAVASVFDPLGLYIPVTVRGKILLQKVWKMGVE